MTDLNKLSGKHDGFDYTIITMPNAPIGILSWATSDAVPNKLQMVNRNNGNGWTLLRKKSLPITLLPSTDSPVENAEEILNLWKQIPVYVLPKPILMGLYSHKAGSFEAIFGVRTAIRPRIDLGTDKVVTRPGTFLVSDLIEAHISRPLVKALMDAGVFHMPKS